MSIPDEDYSRNVSYIRCYDYHVVDTTAGGLLVPKGIIRPVISVSALIWFISNIIEIYSS